MILAWLTARSLARNLPPPIPDRGGFRVETGSATELRRWVFAGMDGGLRALGFELAGPRQFIKVCASDDELRAALDARWQLRPSSFFMMAGPQRSRPRPLPSAYRLECQSRGPVVIARIVASDGSLAASGHAAQTAGAFAYDRIETAPAHRRRGLGNIVMHALRDGRAAGSDPEILVATEDGRALYESLGWSVLAPYATAVIPDGSGGVPPRL